MEDESISQLLPIAQFHERVVKRFPMLSLDCDEGENQMRRRCRSG
jgi:hypothetical protein